MKRAILLFLVFLSLITSQAQAAAPGSALSAEIGAVLNYRAMAQGFAANDPRIAATLSAAGGAAEAIGVSVVVAGTAPAWGTILASAAVAGAVGYALQSLVNYVFNSNGTVTATTPASGPTPDATGFDMVTGGPYYQVGNVYGGDGLNVAMQAQQTSHPGFAVSANTVDSQGNFYYYLDDPNSPEGHCAPYPHGQSLVVLKVSSGAPGDCAVAMVYVTGCQPITPTTPPVTATQSASAALSNLTPAQAATPLAPADVAAIANDVWQQAAAQPGYSGLPYNSSDPITASDVTAARAANPSMQTATVGDLAAPIPTTNAVTQSSGQPVTNTATNPSTQPQDNLGPDPGIGSPALESTPTAQMILAPLLGLFPSLQNFVVPSHSSICPKPTITLWNKTITVDAQCTLAESIRPNLYAIMAFVWLVLSMLIILKA